MANAELGLNWSKKLFVKVQFVHEMPAAVYIVLRFHNLLNECTILNRKYCLDILTVKLRELLFWRNVFLLVLNTR